MSVFVLHNRCESKSTRKHCAWTIFSQGHHVCSEGHQGSGQIAFAVSPMMNLQERPLSIATCRATFLQLFSILFWTSFIQRFCWVHVISPIPDDFGVRGRHGLRCPILWAMLHCCFWPQLQFQTHRFPNKSSVADLPGKNKAM